MESKHLTALITGASSGLGAEFARQLSWIGYNPILVARRKEKLEELSEELKRVYGVSPEILTADLSAYEGMEKVEDYIEKLGGLDMLVNNAGFGIPKKFQDVGLEKLQGMINLHVIAPTRLCYRAIPKMREKGAIINVASIAPLVTKSNAAVYSPTKSYLITFSKILQKDLGNKIKVQVLCPGFVHTSFHDTEAFKGYDVRIPKFLWRDKEYVVKKSLRALGKNKVVCIPGIENKILVSLMNNKLISSILWGYYQKKD